jgi:hypothetical protein
MRLKENSIALLGSALAVDMNAGGLPVTTNIFTVPTGKICYITHVLAKNVTGNLTTAQFSFGFDANGSDVITDATHTGLDGATKYEKIEPDAGAVRGVAADTFKIALNTAQGGAMTADFIAFGFFIDA